MKVLTNRMNWSVMASVVSGCSLVVMFRYLPSLSISARSDFDVTGTGLEWSNFLCSGANRIASNVSWTIVIFFTNRTPPPPPHKFITESWYLTTLNREMLRDFIKL